MLLLNQYKPDLYSTDLLKMFNIFKYKFCSFGFIVNLRRECNDEKPFVQ